MTTAERVLQARDALLIARKTRAEAKAAFCEAVARMYFFDDRGRQIEKFKREIGPPENEYGREQAYWCATAEYIAQDPSAEQYDEDCTSHPDFAAMCAAKDVLRAANQAHGAAMRRLLSVGVKRGAV